VFERRAPASNPSVEAAIAPHPVGNGNSIREINAELLDALAGAYRQAAQGVAS